MCILCLNILIVFSSGFSFIILTQNLKILTRKFKTNKKNNPPPSQEDLTGYKMQKLCVQRSLYQYLSTFSWTWYRKTGVENSLTKYSRNGKTKLAQKETIGRIPVTDQKWHLIPGGKKRSPKGTWTLYKDFVVEYSSFLYYCVTLCCVSWVKANDQQSLQTAHWEKKCGNFGTKILGFVY